MQDILTCKQKVEFFKSDNQNQRYWHFSVTIMRENNTNKEILATLTSLPSYMYMLYIICKSVLHEFKMSYMKPIHAGLHEPKSFCIHCPQRLFSLSLAVSVNALILYACNPRLIPVRATGRKLCWVKIRFATHPTISVYFNTPESISCIIYR